MVVRTDKNRWRSHLGMACLSTGHDRLKQPRKILMCGLVVGPYFQCHGWPEAFIAWTGLALGFKSGDAYTGSFLMDKAAIRLIVRIPHLETGEFREDKLLGSHTQPWTHTVEALSHGLTQWKHSAMDSHSGSTQPWTHTVEALSHGLTQWKHSAMDSHSGSTQPQRTHTVEALSLRGLSLTSLFLKVGTHTVPEECPATPSHTAQPTHLRQ